MSFCVSIRFAAVYLQALGYSNGALGLILVLGNLLGVLVSLALSDWIDRAAEVTASRLLPKVYAFTRGMGSVAYVLISVALGFLAEWVSYQAVPASRRLPSRGPTRASACCC